MPFPNVPSIQRRLFALCALVGGLLMMISVPRVGAVPASPAVGATAIPRQPRAISQTPNPIYLPMMQASSGNSTAPTTTPVPTTAPTPMPTTAPTNPPAAPAAFFLPNDFPDTGVQNTSNVDLAVDANGGVHVVYEIVGISNKVVYAYCPANCTSVSKFSTALLTSGDQSSNDTIYIVNLALDPAGHPRLVWWVYEGLHYVACDSNCTNPASWADTLIGPAEGTDWSGDHFAIDAQGGHHYVYADTETYDGTHYVFCAADCRTASNWRNVIISTALFEKPSIAATAAGQPRFAFKTYDQAASATRFGYLECNAICLDGQNWNGVLLDAISSSESSYALRLTRAGQPRVALAPWSVDNSTFTSNQLFYLWCAASCDQASADSWKFARVPVQGQDVAISAAALALGPTDQPTIAFDTSGVGMQTAQCSTNCESASAAWNIQVIDSITALNANEPVPPKQGCTNPTWSLGYQTSLDIDGSGTPHIGYDARHLWLCSGFKVNTDIMWTRYAP